MLSSKARNILFLAVLLVAVVYFVGPQKVGQWLKNSASILGRQTDNSWSETIGSVQETVSQNIRQPQKADFDTLPQISFIADEGEDNQDTVSSSVSATFDQSIDDLVTNLQSLPEKQLARVKEVLIEEIFPDCQCQCEEGVGEDE